MTRRIKFTASYNHRWPSRAISHFRPDGGPKGDGIYTVKPEVAQAAVPKYATAVEEPAKRPSRGETTGRRSPGRVAGRDPDADRRRARRDEHGSDVGIGGGDGVPVVPDAGE